MRESYTCACFSPAAKTSQRVEAWSRYPVVPVVVMFHRRLAPHVPPACRCRQLQSFPSSTQGRCSVLLGGPAPCHLPPDLTASCSSTTSGALGMAPVVASNGAPPSSDVNVSEWVHALFSIYSCDFRRAFPGWVTISADDTRTLRRSLARSPVMPPREP